MRRRAVAAVVVLACLTLLEGCASTLPGRAEPARVPTADLTLVRGYVAAFNAAGEAGPTAQAEFLRATQEPGAVLPPPGCFGTVSLRAMPIESTLRPATDWIPPRARPPGARPAGAVYVAASAVTTLADGAVVSEVVGLQHFVVRDGRVYGYAACPT